MRPYDKQFVLNLTAHRLLEGIKKSIDYSVTRLSDAPDKGVEIMETVTVLQKWRELNQEFIKNNPHLFEDQSNETPSE